ncbi:MAG: isoleucine--tRNA ligase [Gemmatimonadetes bacterium]|nr:isoleucine--tRNA ligase [Gemmatimonadota bacterium]
MKFPDYPDSVIRLEEQVLEQWRAEDLFRRTLEATAGAPEFVFYEGPPTANGRPGIHHVLSRTIKDLVCRYHTMRGLHITRIAGWDTHGLPVEIEAEKKLGISGKREIEEFGVARFNEVCRSSVFTYKEEWERLSERTGYWLDYSRPYVTFTPEYIESVWWILKQLYGRGLIYRGHKSVAYCPRCGTGLSSHEVALGYEEVNDPSLYFLAPIFGADGEADAEGRAFLVWTTTPWTLPSNAALALHPELPYVDVEVDGARLILAESRVPAVFGSSVAVRRRYRAGELVGLRYRRPFDLVPAPAGSEEAWRAVAEDFVSAEDGTGIVHLAPAFGADDYAAGQRHGLPMLQPLDDAGRFDARLPLVGGQFVKTADEVLVEDLKRRGLVFRYSLEPHTYPHCWRCSSPLLYIARDSWYIRTTAVKDQMLANNRQVHWYPHEVGSGRFGEWLAGNVDWALSRDRYWGTPLPAWVCDREAAHLEFIGSLAELAQRAGGLPEGFDPHKPFIDQPSWECATCGGVMRRTPEVIDVWFDSGAMPYAQWHYPFQNQDAWRRHFPADFICEGVDQTRGWFYSLMAISTLLELGPAYRNVVVNDLVLDAEGQKMSKSRGNVVDPWEAIAQFGADAIRWYLVTGSQPWVSKRFDAQALSESARRTFDTLANTYRFFALYANLEGWAASDADPPTARRAVLDRWLLSRLNALVEQVDRDMEAYEITRAARAVGDFIVDDVSNWYVRRSRDRFWGSADQADTRAAFRTLADTLLTVARLLAPVTPFHADWLHRALTGGTSVHLARFPESQAELQDPRLDVAMDAVRTLARLGRAAREELRLRVRQPLRTMYAVLPRGTEISQELLRLLSDELNVKEVRFLADAGELVELRAQPNFRALGKRFGPRTPWIAEQIRAIPAERLQALRQGQPLTIVVDGEGFELAPDELEVQEAARGELVIEADAGFTIALDRTVDRALRQEGLARELVNRIQRLRREAGLRVEDRIALGIAGAPDVLEAALEHREYIARETLAVRLEADAELANGFALTRELELDGLPARIALMPVEWPPQP